MFLRQNLRPMTSLMICAALGSLVGCKESNVDSSSNLDGMTSHLTNWLPSPHPKSGEALRSIARDFASRLAKTSAAASFKPKTQLQMQLLRTITAHEGIPGYQLYEILRLLISPKSQACGGVSCGRILQMSEQDINPFLNDLLAKVKKSTELQKPENKKNRDLLLASLAKDQDGVLDVQLEKSLNQGSLDQGPLAGTCALSTPQSFSGRNIEKNVHGGHSLTPAIRAIDYRHDFPKQFQGSTGACHLYSAISMLEHSHHERLHKIRQVDIPRTFVDFWTDNLGGSLEKALQEEVDFLHSLAQGRKNFVEKAKAEGIMEFSATEKWRSRAYTHVRMFRQGGYAITDFMRLKRYGAVMISDQQKRLSIRELENISSQLTDERLKIIDQMTTGHISDDEIKNKLRPSMTRLFHERDTNNALRQPFEKELASFTMEKVSFDKEHMDQSVDLFMKTFEKYGPIGISRRSHATTVVSYDPVQKVFYLRDSAAHFGMPYTPVSQNSFFAYLDSYYILKETQSHD